MFSLIIGTLNRSVELEHCINSLIQQSIKEFEIIVIDQSTNDETERMINSFMDKRIIYKHVNFRGLSKARNEALKIAKGEYFCLIDDDAFYPKDYLQKINIYLKKYKGNTIISGYMWDTLNQQPFVKYEKLGQEKWLSIREVMRYCPSPCTTFPMILREDIGYFDEELGVGGKYGAGEETEYMLRAINRGYRTLYVREIEIKHPHEKVVKMYDVENAKKKISYMQGAGAMIKKSISLKNIRSRVILYRNEIIIKRLVKLIMGDKQSKNELRAFIEGYRAVG